MANAASSWATSGARVSTTATIRQQFATSTTCLRKEIATTQVLLPNHRMYAATTSPALEGVGGGAARAFTVGARSVFLPVYALDGLIIVSGTTSRKRTWRNAPPAMAPCSTHTMRAPIKSCNRYIYNPTYEYSLAFASPRTWCAIYINLEKVVYLQVKNQSSRWRSAARSLRMETWIVVR
jgi:hypothetical protein